MASICSGETCQAVIDWAVWPDGTHRHPITRPAPCPGPGERCTHEGNLAIWWAGGRMRWRTLVEGEQIAEREHRARSHYADCPDAAAFKCPKCRHKPHPAGPCAKPGRIDCRTVDLGGDRGSARVRGRFPCGCTEGVKDAPADPRP